MFFKKIFFFCMISFCSFEALNFSNNVNFFVNFRRRRRLPRTAGMKMKFRNTDWCKFNCAFGATHIACAYRGDCDPKMPSCEITDLDADKVVELHNNLRNNFALGNEPSAPGIKVANMLLLEWDDELAFLAGCNLKLCEEEAYPDRCHRTEKFPLVGQNIASAAGVEDCEKHVYEVLIQKWYDQIKNVTEKEIRSLSQEFRSNEETDQFTQMIWATTAHVGCSAIRHKTDNNSFCLLTCNYGPSGNLPGNVMFREGSPASKCPQNFHVDSKYPGLCGKAHTEKPIILMAYIFVKIVINIF